MAVAKMEMAVHKVLARIDVDIRLLVLALGGLNLGLTLLVMRLYFLAHSYKEVSPRRVPGALPYHVGIMAGAHSLLSVSCLVLLGYRIFSNEPIYLWFISSVSVAWLMTLFALITVLKYEHCRLRDILKEDHTGG